MRLYLIVDILLLTEIFEKFRTTIYGKYGLDPSMVVTAPSLSLQCALYTSRIKIELLNDLDIFTLFETSIRGGLVSVISGYEEFNNKSLPSYDKTKPIKSGALMDFNSLYPVVLSEKLPYGGFYELSENEVLDLDIKNLDTQGDYAYALLIDFLIPDEVKRYTDDLPLAFCHKSPPYEDLSPFTKNLLKNCKINTIKSKKLIACHENQEKYLIALPLLKLYIELGVKVTKIRRVFRFNQKAFLSDFINTNIELRKQSTSKCDKDFYKILSNGVFGKFLFNERRGKNKVRLINNREKFKKLSCNPFLKDCFAINEESLVMRFTPVNLTLQSPLYIGWFILELSKLKTYSFYYNVVKKNYGDSARLQYTDTDSLLLCFDGLDVLEELGKLPLSMYADTSNFHVDHPLHSEENKGKLGYLKSETGSIPLKESICLACKCYSLLLGDDAIKAAAKGVPKGKQHLCRHEKYKQIHNNSEKCMVIKCVNIACKKNRLYTIKSEKRALGKFENKRFWINKRKSLAYGHPDIPLYTNDDMSEIHEQVCDERECITKRKNTTKTQKNITQRSLALTFRRSEPGRKLYNIL